MLAVLVVVALVVVLVVALVAAVVVVLAVAFVVVAEARRLDSECAPFQWIHLLTIRERGPNYNRGEELLIPESC